MYVIPNSVFSKNIVLNISRKVREFRFHEDLCIRVQDVDKVGAGQGGVEELADVGVKSVVIGWADWTVCPLAAPRRICDSHYAGGSGGVSELFPLLPSTQANSIIQDICL